MRIPPRSSAHRADSTVKLWKVPYAPFESGDVCAEERAVYEFEGKAAFRAIDHHWSSRTFATASAAVDIWDHSRAEPVHTFSWGSESVLSVRCARLEAFFCFRISACSS